MKNVIAVNAFKSLQTTSALCKAANVTRGQLRLYEEEGLIAPQGRTEAGYRQYGSDTLDRLKAVMHLKQLGFTLAEVALLLSDRDRGVLDEPAIQQLAGKLLSKIDESIAGLQVIRSYVAPVSVGNMSVLQDGDCNFVVEFMTALSDEKTRRRA
ncbi:MAG: MerR family transcriptional regulator [Hydrogenophaga sp.]|nr:MerR family transcriptional regulator [Hydrogenophaga sp.]